MHKILENIYLLLIWLVKMNEGNREVINSYQFSKYIFGLSLRTRSNCLWENGMEMQ